MRRWAPLAGLFAVAGLLAQADIEKTTPQDAAVVSGKHVTVRIQSAGLTATPGQSITLTLDVTPGPKIHLYAPGQPGYIPVAFTLEKSQEFTASAAVFPAPHPFFFEPTNERLQVYDAPFRITQALTLSRSETLERRAAAKDTLHITGVLNYQACDDQVCYRPDAVPLAWDVALAPAGR